MDSSNSNSKSKSKNRKRKNRNKNNKNQTQSNGNKNKLITNEIHVNQSIKPIQQLPSSPRPTNISKDQFIFDRKRSSGSEFEEFHTPSCEYPELKNSDSTKENDLDQEWKELGDFKSSSLEGIPEINYSQNLKTELKVQNNDPFDERHPVVQKPRKSKSNKKCNGFVPKSHKDNTNDGNSRLLIENINCNISESQLETENYFESNIIIEKLKLSTENQSLTEETLFNSINSTILIHSENPENDLLVKSSFQSNEEENVFVKPVVEESIETIHHIIEIRSQVLENPFNENTNNNEDINVNNTEKDENIDIQGTDSKNETYFENRNEEDDTNINNESVDGENQCENLKDKDINDENETMEILGENTETDDDITNLKSLTDMEYESIYCTDENLEEELLVVPEWKVEHNYKTYEKTKSMSLNVKDLDSSHRHSATTITNVTSISDENINLNYQTDIKRPKSKIRNKFIQNFFSKLKKRKITTKTENNEPNNVPVETIRLENHDFFDETSIDCQSQTKGLEIDSNKALKSYDDSINNIGDPKPFTDDECTESDNVFINENLNNNNKNKDNELNIQEQTINKEFKSNSNSNTQSPVKSLLINDIESLDNSFKFLKDFDKDSIKSDNEKVKIKIENLINDNPENPNLFENNNKTIKLSQKSSNEPCEKTDQHHFDNEKSKKPIKQKFLTLFSKKEKKRKTKRTQSLSREYVNEINNEIVLNKKEECSIHLTEEPIIEFNKIVNSLKIHLNDENEKVICKNKNDFPLNIVDECLINEEISYINDDHLFPDAITPSKIIHLHQNESYNFPFIDDPIIIAQDSLTMFKGENKKIIFLTEFCAPFASLETLSRRETDDQCASTESLYSTDIPMDVKIAEKAGSPIRSNKRPMSAILNFLSRTR